MDSITVKISSEDARKILVETGFNIKPCKFLVEVVSHETISPIFANMGPGGPSHVVGQSVFREYHLVLPPSGRLTDVF